VLLAKQQQPFSSIKPLNASTTEHVTDLKKGRMLQYKHLRSLSK
jgi:hypothetical protein